MLAHKNDSGKERAINYISKTLVVYEISCSPIEKLCYAIVFATEKLRHYVLGNTTYVVAQADLVRYLLFKTHV